MAYTFPILVETTVGSNTILGIIMACSSIAGIAFDIIIPKFFDQKSWFRLLATGIVLSTLVPILILLGINLESIFIFLIASIIWGIYFEFMIFSVQDFVASEEKRVDFTKDWGVINAFWGVATLIGPVVGTYLISNKNNNLILLIIFIQIFSLIFFNFFYKKDKKED